ncbi:hypothetical protein SAMN04487972_12631 [Paracoccus halophilus]|uniref:Polyketide cyclase / dehydrase and lipid transport n=1 Tax=Paracoccus halophilus TaxID=376733 RepID=A0A099EXV0_9RHOB|nr:hypothetical protein [Paracoccus halophilus]KGJ02803.1 hypothetical protein IT41_16460 [Paracoccus halophilus]SFA60066.1 hypothetical protein SAMN04487972_12631 [Paracoccus halophilus]
MKFSTRQDTELSAESLFSAISNFDAIERMLTRRGASVRREDALTAPAVGMSWLIGFDFRGRYRELSLQLTRIEPPETIVIEGGSDQFDLSIQMTVLALTKTKSRLIFVTEVQPRSLKARLILQTVKLGKPQLDKKFAQRIGEFADNLAAVS